MPRRKTSKQDSPFEVIFQTLMLLPWWGGFLMAGLTYAAAAWALPAFLTRDQASEQALQIAGEMLAGVSVQIAPFLALGVLGMSMAAEIKKWRDRRLLDVQTGAESIRDLDWRAFERLLAEAFRRQGYLVEDAGGRGADGGVDLTLVRAGRKTLVQCKHWKKRQVGVKVIRELKGVAASERADGGIVVTSGAFTTEAVAFAREAGVQLIDGAALSALIQSAKGPASQEVRKEAPAPQPATTPAAPAPQTAETSLSAAPTCPKCGGAMERRTAKRGANAGAQFWGCTNYPRCRGIMNAPR